MKHKKLPHDFQTGLNGSSDTNTKSLVKDGTSRKCVKNNFILVENNENTWYKQNEISYSNNDTELPKIMMELPSIDKTNYTQLNKNQNTPQMMTRSQEESIWYQGLIENGNNKNLTRHHTVPHLKNYPDLELLLNDSSSQIDPQLITGSEFLHSSSENKTSSSSDKRFTIDSICNKYTDDEVSVEENAEDEDEEEEEDDEVMNLRERGYRYEENDDDDDDDYEYEDETAETSPSNTITSEYRSSLRTNSSLLSEEENSFDIKLYLLKKKRYYGTKKSKFIFQYCNPKPLPYQPLFQRNHLISSNLATGQVAKHNWKFRVYTSDALATKLDRKLAKSMKRSMGGRFQSLSTMKGQVPVVKRKRGRPKKVV